MGAKQLTSIMVVEDEVITARSIEKSLKDLGYNVVGLATSGEEAIERIAYLRPDLVLMDITLKGTLDGVYTAQRVQAQFDIPVVYLTAHSDEKTVKRVMYSKPYGYVVKPFKEGELRQAIENALQRHGMKRKIIKRD